MSFASRIGTENRKVDGAFHSAQSIQNMKDAQQDLHDVVRSSERRILLTAIGALLSMFGLFVTFAIAEVCGYGYLPTDSEILEGISDPYAIPGHCDGSNTFKLWLLQATVSFSTSLLGLVVVQRNRVTLQEREQQIMFIARNSDPPNMSTISFRLRRARRQTMWRDTIIEILFTVLPHPLPGFKHTFEMQALQRVGKYELEMVIVVFMLPRFYHVWKLVMYNLFYKNFEQCTYMLGNHHSIMTMMSHWQDINSSFALKMLFTEEPVKCVFASFPVLLFSAAYCMRAAETPVNAFHAGLFGNNLWLVIATLCLVIVHI